MSLPDHFALLSLPRQVDLDRDALEARYLELAREFHPDRVAAGDTAGQRAAVERSAALNEAHRTLRDPVRRAEYLCKLGGIDLDSSDARGGAPSMGQAFLLDMIERRERLADARGGRAGEIDAFRDDLERELAAATAAAIAELRAGHVRPAAERLVVRRYLKRLLDEVEAVDG